MEYMTVVFVGNESALRAFYKSVISPIFMEGEKPVEAIFVSSEQKLAERIMAAPTKDS